MRITSDFCLLILFRDAGCAIRVSCYGLRVLLVTRISQHETFFPVTATDYSSFNFRLPSSHQISNWNKSGRSLMYSKIKPFSSRRWTNPA